MQVTGLPVPIPTLPGIANAFPPRICNVADKQMAPSLICTRKLLLLCAEDVYTLTFKRDSSYVLISEAEYNRITLCLAWCGPGGA